MNECGKIWQNLAYMQVKKTNTQNKEWMNAGKLTKFGLHASKKNKYTQ